MALTATSRFHRYGPWLVGGAALIFGIAFEAARHHVVTRFEVLFFCVLIPTVILHEIAHGIVANWCGDNTAKAAGRLSLNPLRHIDPIGTVLLPILLILTTHSAFGWAKPVPVSINRLRSPRNQAVLVALAGPAVNIILALVAGFVFHAIVNLATLPLSLDSWSLVDEIVFLVGYVNVIIAAFNLIPLPPLDGSAVLERLLPISALPSYYRMRQASMLLVLFFVFFAPGVLDTIFNHALIYWGDVIGVPFN